MSNDNREPAASNAASEGVALAETDALQAEAQEQAAHQRFDSMRNELTAQGRADEVTRHPDFHRWMASRVTTDEAWGRWALAMHAAEPAA